MCVFCEPQLKADFFGTLVFLDFRRKKNLKSAVLSALSIYLKCSGNVQVFEIIIIIIAAEATSLLSSVASAAEL